MFAAALIVFREVLEAALIVGIITAATQGLPNRARWIGGGILAGLFGSTLVAGATDYIAELASGMGQEMFNACILGLAVVMLAWHNIWMASHGKEMASQARNVGKSIRDGAQECSVLFVIIFVAILREGSETALFLYGIVTAEGEGLRTAVSGGSLGLLGGVTVGWLLYNGLLRIPLRWFFSATSALVLLLAAGMASQAARFLIQADVLPSLGSPLWDTSALIEQKSIAGVLLHGLTGYDATPAGMQVLFYIAVLITISIGMKLANRPATVSATPS
ncbi:MAG TPA: FTR1 family protein [Rhodocyclaceae bacterium]